MRKQRARLILLLAIAVFTYGSATSADVFLPAFSLPEEAHQHSHQGSSYCGFVYQAPDFPALYSLPFFNGYAVSKLSTETLVFKVTAEETRPLVPVSFQLYRFRAPPEWNG